MRLANFDQQRNCIDKFGQAKTILFSKFYCRLQAEFQPPSLKNGLPYLFRDGKIVLHFALPFLFLRKGGWGGNGVISL